MVGEPGEIGAMTEDNVAESTSVTQETMRQNGGSFMKDDLLLSHGQLDTSLYLVYIVTRTKE